MCAAERTLENSILKHQFEHLMVMMRMPCLLSVSFTCGDVTLCGQGCMQERTLNMTLNRIRNHMMFVHCTEPMPSRISLA